MEDKDFSHLNHRDTKTQRANFQILLRIFLYLFLCATVPPWFKKNPSQNRNFTADKLL